MEKAGSGEPDVVLACASGTPTVEVLAAASIPRDRAPELVVRVVNIVDLLDLAPDTRHPHGMNEADFANCFGDQTPVVAGGDLSPAVPVRRWGAWPVRSRPRHRRTSRSPWHVAAI